MGPTSGKHWSGSESVPDAARRTGGTERRRIPPESLPVARTVESVAREHDAHARQSHRTSFQDRKVDDGSL